MDGPAGNPEAGTAPDERVARLEEEVRRLAAELDELAAAAEEREEAAAVAAQEAFNAVQADLLRARRRADAAERRAERLADEIREIRDSFTWKAGRVVKRAVDPAIAARQALGRRRWTPTAAKRSGTPASPAAATGEGATPAAPGSLAAPFPLVEDSLRSAYGDAVRHDDFTGQPGGGPNVAFAVFTTDLDEGRGDLYVAAGIGRSLAAQGARVAHLPEDEWAELPADTDVVVAMLPTFRPSRVPSRVRCVAWVRNETDAWLAHTELGLFDGVLASTERARAAIARAYDGPTDVLPIGVDLELFSPPSDGAERAGVVATVNAWGKERELHRALRTAPIGFPLALFGHDRALPPALAGYAAGPVSFFALPEVYRRAAVVLDDFNHTTVGWGNVNSRVFEALACGAPVVTNTARGLAELGLGDVPTFADGAELAAVVEALLADPDGAAGLGSRLSATVAERHGYAARAAALLGFLDWVEPGRRRVGTVVAFYPGDYREGNPYQDMLYAGLDEVDAVAVPTMEPFEPARLPEFARADHAKVLHIHWTAPILGPALSATDATARGRQLLAGIDELRAAGGRLVWTVHNVMPHECPHPDQEVELRQGLADRADVVHVMCEATADEVRSRYTLPPERTVVIPHASFIGVYGDAMDRATARRLLGVGRDDVVLVALGGIRRYKGIDRLLDAFDEALRTERRLRLVVVGRPGRFEGAAELERRCRQHPRVISRFERVEDDDLQMYLKASDVAVLPHRSVLNSGSLLLAYTFGVPAIAPSTGCVAELLDPAGSIGFDPADDAALLAALRRAPTLATPDARRAAREVAERYTPPDMAADFAALLRQAVG